MRESGQREKLTGAPNLTRNPRSIHEAIDLANRIVHGQTPVTIEGEGISSVSGPSGKLGEMVSFPAAKGEENWYDALFAQTEFDPSVSDA